MRFVWAVLAFILAAAAIGGGIAQRTIFVDREAGQVSIDVPGGAAYVMIDGSVLGTHAGTQTLEASVPGKNLTVAYGRTADMSAWLSDATYAHVTLDAQGAPVSQIIEPSVTAPETPRNPAGSDLWLGEATAESTVSEKLQVPQTMSVLVATDGQSAAPATIDLSWPVSNLTPWAGPLILLGVILLAVGIVLYILAVRHLRRSRGPRRKGPPPLAITEPLQTIDQQGLDEAGAGRGVITATPTRRSLGRGRRFVVTVPAMVVAGALLAGCSPESWPQVGSSDTPEPTASVVVPEGEQPPAVTQAQAGQILERVAATVAQADSTLDATLAGTRLADAMLDERTANYTIRGKFSSQAALAAIPTAPLMLVLPQSMSEWPRSVVTVIADPAKEKDTPVIAVLQQQDAWSPYKLSYLSNLTASSTVPDVAPAEIGARSVPPESPFLLLPPAQVAAAYADVLQNGDNSASAALFDAESDEFRAKVQAKRDEQRAQFNQSAAETGTIDFGSLAGSYAPVSLATIESGAIVAVSVFETETVKPTTSDATIKLDGDSPNETVQALTGTTSSNKGYETTFSDQLFFYVPNKAAGGKIQLLAFDSHVLNAKVLP